MGASENRAGLLFVVVAVIVIFGFLHISKSGNQTQTDDISLPRSGVSPLQSQARATQGDASQCDECRDWKLRDIAWREARTHRERRLNFTIFHGFDMAPEYPCPTGIVKIGGGMTPLGMDGVKLVCLDHPDVSPEVDYNTPGGCLMLSVGSNGDFSYETDLHKHRPNCDIHTFDPTVKQSKQKMAELRDELRVTYHLTGISNRVGKLGHGDLKPLTQVMKELGKKHISILKIDCEGCEWDAFYRDIFPAMQEGTLEINQLLIEMHYYHPAEPLRNQMEFPLEFLTRADEVGLRMHIFELNIYARPFAEYGFIFVKRPKSCDVCPEALLGTV